MATMYVGVIPENGIKPDLKSTAKSDVIEELLDVLVAGGYVTDREGVLQALFDREAQGSTAVGRGVAFPHCKTEGVRELATAFGRSVEGIEFGAEDGKPVHLFFLMVAPPGKSGPHVKALGRLAKLVADHDCCKELFSADTVERVVRVLTAAPEGKMKAEG